MRLIVEKKSPVYRDVVMTIGMFDGLHRGHQYIIKEVIRRARLQKKASLVITFWPHPRTILAKKFDGHLMNLAQKEKILASFGLDYLWVIKSGQSLFKMSGEAFMDKVLRQFRIKEMIVGQDFKFGRKAGWKGDRIKEFSLKAGFKLSVLSKKTHHGQEVSSSLVRRLIGESRFQEAKDFLSRPYVTEGRVVRGKGLGRKLGCPTANIKNINNFLLPPRGVYAAYVRVNRKFFLGAVNVGTRPTVERKAPISLEAAIFDFQSDIVGEKIQIVWLEKIRNERKFPSLFELQRAIAADIAVITSKYSISPRSIPQLIVS